MSSLPTPNFVLMVEFNVPSYGSYGTRQDRTLPAGAFVRPIEPRYVPQFILDRDENRWFNEAKEAYCYCRFGIVVIPKNLMRQT